MHVYLYTYKEMPRAGHFRAAAAGGPPGALRGGFWGPWLGGVPRPRLEVRGRTPICTPAPYGTYYATKCRT